MTHRTALSFAVMGLLTLPVSASDQTGRATAPSGSWRIDSSRSLVQFTVTKFGFSDVTGRFTDFAGTIHYDAVTPHNSSVQWRVRVASVQTGEPGRDTSLQAPEYFDARRHPELSFRSVRVKRLSEEHLEVDGELTLKGITRAQRLIAKPADGGFETAFEIDRFDFDIVGGVVMRSVVGRTARIRLVAIAEGHPTGSAPR